MNAHVPTMPVERQGDPGPCPVISTQRLVLRPHRLGDAAGIALSLSDYQVARMLSRVPVPYFRQDALDWLDRQASNAGSPRWALAMTKGDDAHIGSIGIEFRQGHWHIGYWLNRNHWGAGLMTEAVQAAAGHFFHRMPRTELSSGVFADNPASLNVQKKLGFRVTGCNQIYALARNEMVSHIETALTAGDLKQP